MKRILLVVALLSVAAGAGPRPPVAPFEADSGGRARNAVDTAVLAALDGRGIRPAPLCSDEVFVRRAYLDVIGRLPDPQDVLRFLDDRRPDRRARLVDALLARDEDLADYWAMRWCDVLRVKSEFPINLWPAAAQAYHDWIREALRQNMPLDRFARELLTASGSNFRVPQANFFRAVPSRDPAGLAQAAALAFMGTRLERWPEDRRAGLAAFFARVAYKRTREWKEEIVYTAPAVWPLEAVFPDGARVTIEPEKDPRRVFADWLTAPGNPWFARSIVNRTWALLIGRGIIEEPDDIRADSVPSNHALLACLEKELTRSRFDLRHLLRLILNSATYQQSSIPRSAGSEAEALFAHYVLRRLDAEVLVDALCEITGTGESYVSAVPEPFEFIPEEVRSVALADGSVTSPLLDMFGRPARDSGLLSERTSAPSEEQRIHLLNSSDVRQRIRQALASGRLTPVDRRHAREAIGRIYLLVLSRRPTGDEVAVAEKYARTSGLPPGEAAQDLVWALLNGKEFLYRH